MDQIMYALIELTFFIFFNMSLWHPIFSLTQFSNMKHVTPLRVPQTKVDINGLYILIMETDKKWVPKELIGDPNACMQAIPSITLGECDSWPTYW